MSVAAVAAIVFVCLAAAVALGLLVSSAKESFDAEREQVNVLAAKIVVGWLVAILFGFGILAPRNAVATTALITSAVAVCGAVLLLLELVIRPSMSSSRSRAIRC